jgi:SAM-dependent methyltransferase
MPEPDVNHWFEERCARAFWDQRQGISYQELLRDTAHYLKPQPGEVWLDLGCGGGRLTALLWTLADGQLESIVAADCAAVNIWAIERLQRQLEPRPAPAQLSFCHLDLSHGLPDFPDHSFDGVVSGLALSYAESRDPRTGRYTEQAYNRIFAEIFRVLKPGGKLVFSVNVPEPRFWRVLWRSLNGGWKWSRAGRLLVNALRMQRYGGWLKREARRGRFHYLPIEELRSRLQRVGFEAIEHRLSYAEQAYVVSVHKPAVAGKSVA